MSKLVYSKLFINTEPVLVGSNYSIQLEQEMAEHHKLTIVCPTEAVESAMGEFASTSKNFVGASISIQVGTGSSYGVIDNPELQFTGIITNVTINQHDAIGGDLQIVAHSPTILLTHGSDSQSFEQKTLNDIIKAATEEYPENAVTIEKQAVFSDPIPYSVQYKENDFDFIRRLAKRYGEWFYYDGEVVQFGKLKSDNTLLTYGQNLDLFNFTMQTRPQNHQFLAYDAKKAELHVSSMSEFAESTEDPYINHITNTSKGVFAKTPTSIYNHSLLDNGKAELDFVAKQKAAKALNTVIFNGQSEEPNIQVGTSTTIQGLAHLGGTAYGSYTITKVIHHIDTTGEYTNEFTGVPIDITVPAYFNEDAVPACEEQFAVVKDNDDPEGLSRIRVQFPWQILKNELSPWIRLTTPYAGEGKGFHVLPEIGEEVLMGFENGNAEKPYCLGAMYNGSGKSGHGGKGNFIKGMQTTQGQRMQMNDEEGSLSFQDNGGVKTKMDGKGNYITDIAKDQLISAGKSHIIKIVKGKFLPPRASMEANEMGNVVINAMNSITLRVGGNIIHISNDGIRIESQNGIVNMFSSKPMDIVTEDDLTIAAGGIGDISSSDTYIS